MNFNPRIPAGCDCARDRQSPHHHNHFNPRIPAGCDPGAWQHFGRRRDFNPRIPAGCDIDLRMSRANFCIDFNPRIPAGCDRQSQDRGQIDRYFNPRIPAGCDIKATKADFYSDAKFQSTHPCGMRPGNGSATRCGRLNFNPRIPAGCDVTRVEESAKQAHKNFNPRIPAGCDSVKGPLSSQIDMISIHASLRDATMLPSM